MFRYDPKGGLNPIFPAAFAGGQGAPQSGGPGMMDILNLNSRLREMTNEDDAKRLQTAAQTTNPQVYRPQQQSSMLPQLGSVQAAKSLARTTSLAGIDLTPDQQTQLNTLEKDPSLSVNEYQDVVGRIAKSNQDQQKETDKATKEQNDADGKARLALQAFQSIKDPNMRANLKAIALAKTATIDDVRIAVAQAMSRQSEAERQQYSEQRTAQSNQLATMRPEVEGMRHQFTKDHPDLANLLDAPATDVVDAMADGVPNPDPGWFGSATTPLDPSTQSDLMAFRRLRSEQQGAAVPINASTQQSNGPVRVNTPQEALALAPGTSFITPDGRLKVRP